MEYKRELEALEVVRKKRACLEGRLRKESYASLSDRLGVSVPTVRVWVKEMTQTMLPQEEIEELRAQEAAGYDRSEALTNTIIEMAMREGAQREREGLSTLVIQDQLAKLNQQLNDIRKARALLLGMNVPAKVEHKVTVRTEFDAEVESLVADLLGGGMVLTQPDFVDVGDDG